ncbi:MAG: GxxExxY protein [Bacteroidota bacterium]
MKKKFTLDDAVIVAVKALKNFDTTFEDKLLHYLRTTNYTVELIINFC